MKLFVNNEVDNALVSSPDEDINYPASNVKDTRLSRFFRGDKSIDFDITGAGSPKTIAQAYTNLVTDPVDLTTGNWTEINGCVASDPSLTINGNAFTKLTTDGTANPQIRQIKTVTSGVSNVASVILRNGNLSGAETSTFFYIDNVGLATTLGQLTITWATKSVVQNDGDDFDYTWIDDDTVELYLEVTTDQVSTRYRIDPDNGTVAGKYIYATECQVVDSTTTMFPFVDGTHSADVIDETFTMPDRFIVDLIIDFRFRYDVIENNYLAIWYVSATQQLILYYDVTGDKIQTYWDDGGTGRILASYQFDDGSSFTNLNQRIKLSLFVNAVSGGQTDSMLVSIPLESGAINIDNSFSGTPSIKSSTFPTLSIGHEAGAIQADSVYEYLRVYEWSGTKPTITSSQDMTDYLADKKVLLDKTYMARLTATDLIIAKSTINDGDVITLRGNDWDSFNSGIPVDETVTWSKDIITHTFTKASYQHWRLSVNSSNVIDIGRLFLGLGYSTPYLGVDISHSYQSGTVKTRTPVGVTYGDIRIKENLISIKWPKILTATDKPALITAFDFVDISKPFFWMFDDNVSLLGTLYGTIDGNGLHFVYYTNAKYCRAAISFIEEKG